MATPGAETGRGVSVAVRVNGWVALVTTAAVATVAWSAATQRIDLHDLRTVLVLVVLAVGYEWLARVEVLHRRLNAGPYVTLDSVWVLAAVCTLPLPLTAAVIAVIWGHAGYQARRAGAKLPLIRDVYNISAAILPAAVVTFLFRSTGILVDVSDSLTSVLTAAVLASGVVIYLVVNTAFVGGVIAISTGERSVSRLAGSSTENMVEVASLSLGVLVGISMHVNLWLAVLAVPLLVLLQRIALVEHLESAANKDSKTGLLNAAAFNNVVERDLERARVRGISAAVMVIDLDHFKRVNDTYGHLTGDVVLRAVAECMHAMLRDRDQIARFGGEEFVAFLPGVDTDEALKVAERLRRRIADTAVEPVGPRADVAPAAGVALAERTLGTADTQHLVRITASIGLATFPGQGESLDDLLARADSALYEAKNGGRNQIRRAA